MEKRLQYLKACERTVTIDGDTHPSNWSHLPTAVLQRLKSSPDYYQGKPISLEDLISEMDQAQVSMANSWQNPAVMHYDHSTEDLARRQETNYQLLLRANEDIFRFSKRFPTRIIPSGWTDHKALGMRWAKKLVDVCIHEFGFLIVKMNPAQNEFPMDSEEIFELTGHIIDQGGVPAFHYGGDTEFTPPSALTRLATQFHNSRIIAVHMGGGGSHYVHGDDVYLQTRALGLRHPNLFFILSAIRDCHMLSNLIAYQLAGPPFSHNIACGSDAPYGTLTWNFGGFRQMFASLQDHENHPDPRIQENPGLFDDESVQNYLGGNFARFMIQEMERLLDTEKNSLNL